MISAPDQPPTYWDAPGADPWRGTFDRAAELLAGAGGIPPAVYADIIDHGRCVMRDVREGERIDAMTFGRDQVETNVVARPSHWRSNVVRLTLDCTDSYGRHALLPVACGNYSYEGPRWRPAGGPLEGGYGGWAPLPPLPPYPYQEGLQTPPAWGLSGQPWAAGMPQYLAPDLGPTKASPAPEPRSVALLMVALLYLSLILRRYRV